MQTPQPNNHGSNRKTIIGVAIAILLCCCFTATAIGVYYGYRAYVAAQTAVDQLENLNIPSIDELENLDIPGVDQLENLDIPSIDLGNAPQGGLADEATRSSAWLSVQLVAVIAGCESPAADGSSISVVQEPDASGVWVEEWNVKCSDGSSQPFKVTFTPENGSVGVNVELP